MTQIVLKVSLNFTQPTNQNCLLTTYANSQGVDISVTVCFFVCFFVYVGLYSYGFLCRG